MEIKDKILDPHFPQCPVRNVIARIGDRWSILIMLTLEPAADPMRFKDIQAAIPDISQKMLTRTLRDLEADGFVSRIAYAEVPPRVEYQLTPRARTLTPLLNDLVQWAASNLSAIVKDRQNYYLPKS
ncbi:MAG: helix-turn-helix transcriptional regulator [Bacteroidaceae bacterium]|nr:helix-turn-helix transcriptional regulator [Bacteroidaceae bacterium]